MQFYEVQQNTHEWMKLRRGILTASAMNNILAGGAGKTRRTYRNRLVAERCTGRTAPTFYNEDMERGHEQEQAAIDRYEFVTGTKVEKDGFFRAFDEIGGVGFSPDGRVGGDGLVEIKSKRDDLQIAFLLDEARIPKEHYVQIQTGLWVTGREYCDYICFNDFLPPFIRRVKPDPVMFEKLHLAATEFNAEVEICTDKVMKMIEECKEPPIDNTPASLQPPTWRES